MTTRAVKIIEQLAGDRVVIECAFCSGSGKMQGFEAHVACRVCQGKGQLTIQGRAPLSPCASCEGHGHTSGEEWHVACPSCHGSGVQSS